MSLLPSDVAASERSRWPTVCVASLCFLLSTQAQELQGAGYEIVAHRARIQLSPSAGAISCLDTVSIRLGTPPPPSVTLKLFPLYQIESLTIEGKEVRFKRAGDGVTLDQIPSDKQFDVVISYGTQNSFRTETTSMTTTRAILREEDILPYGPRALEFVRLQLVMPKEWEGITVGRLVARDTTDASVRCVWEAREPMPMIGVICAGTYWKLEDSNGGVPISVHLFDEDSATAKRTLLQARNILRFYGQRFTPYRFSKLAIVEIEDWVGGPNVLAVAVPSLVMVKQMAFTIDDPFNQAQSILPHEVAHQWWPATVYVEASDLPFLAEGMCEYSALMYNEQSGAKTNRDTLRLHPFLRPLIARLLKGKDVPLLQQTDMRALYTHYLKASYVHNMLRRTIGDSVFYQLYHEFAVRYAVRQADLDDFQKLAEELSGMKLGWFFDQWVRRTGVPRLKIYNVKFLPNDNGWTVQGRVRIVGYDKFTTVADVGVETPSGITKTRVWLGADSLGRYRNDVPFEITTGEPPVRVMLDPDGDLLKIQKLPAKFSDLREPADALFIVGSLQHSDYLLSLARRDSAELVKRGWSVRIKNDSNITLGHLQMERVFLYGTNTENRVVAENQGRFPMKFQNGGITINGELISDSTLALMQIIENPFNAQDLMCWIAPFSEHADPKLSTFDASWVIVRGKDEIVSGTWKEVDSDLVVDRK